MPKTQYLKTLCLQTTLPQSNIVFLTNKNQQEITFSADRTQSQQLFDAIEKLTSKEKPEQILIISGPGAFTGLRVGITSANSIALALRIPVAKITTFTFLRAQTNNNTSPVALPGGREIIWQEEDNSEIQFLSPTEFTDKIKQYSQIITSELIDIPESKKTNLLKTASKTFQTILTNEKLDWQKQVEPDYFREPYITKSKRQNSRCKK